MFTHKSRTALHLAASSNSASRLCSTDSASRPISVTLTENSGFPASCATLSGGNFVKYFVWIIREAKTTYLLSMFFQRLVALHSYISIELT